MCNIRLSCDESILEYVCMFGIFEKHVNHILHVDYCYTVFCYLSLLDKNVAMTCQYFLHGSMCDPFFSDMLNWCALILFD